MKIKDLAPLGIRIPPDLKELVQAAAAREGRSMNSQIVQNLKEIYQRGETVETGAR